ncbi:hypothetical protein HanHA300_Chr08g0297541 [Helianthus annuus]|nr:hypothetical protein HanHA300_Chr08g0297541 [Helianthus annuus]
MIQDDNSKSRNLIKLKNEHSGSGTGTGLSDNVTVEKLASQWSLKENMVQKRIMFLFHQGNRILCWVIGQMFHGLWLMKRIIRLMTKITKRKCL